MIEALERYLVHAARTQDHHGAVVVALESVADRPWDVVRLGSLLARCVLGYADEELGLTRQLEPTSPGGKHAVITVRQGQPYPMLAQVGRRGRSPIDPPLDVARRIVASAMATVDGPLRTALDPACGCGAFLLALAEAGVEEIYGTDLDPLALTIAQIAVPQARLLQESPLKFGPQVDLLVGTCPWFPPQDQDRYVRKDLRRRFPWLGPMMDLCVPTAATGVERVRRGGAVGLLLPSEVLVQPYAAVIRRRWLERHRVVELSGPHEQGTLPVSYVVLGVGQQPGPLPVFGVEPSDILRLENAPFDPDLRPGDVELVERIRSLSIPLRRVAELDTGLLAHGPHGSQHRVIHEEQAEGRVPYADAVDFFSRRLGWLDYQPGKLHRPKTRELFEQPKIVVQVARDRGPIRAAIDWDGVFLGHTCALILPRDQAPPMKRLLELLRSPLTDAVGRIELGHARDLHPTVLGRLPVPIAWLEDPSISLQQAWQLKRGEVERLQRVVR